MISDKCSLGQIEFLIEQLKGNKISDIIDLSDAWDLLPEKLTIKQLFFCQHYVTHRNGAEAARQAGYSAKTATDIAAENLGKPHLRKKIEELMQEKLNAAGATADYVVDSLKRLADANQRVNDDGIPVDSTAANKSLELIGKTHGLYTDKKDVTVGGSFNIQWLDPAESPETPGNTEENGADVE